MSYKVLLRAFLFFLPLIFILFKKYFSKYSQEFKNILLLLISLGLYQILYPINLNQTINILQLVFLSHYKFFISSFSFLIALFLYFISQDNIQLSIINSEHFNSQSVKKLKSKKENYLNLYSESRTKLNRKNIQYLLKDIPRHGYLTYTNKNSLTEKYFQLSKHYIQKENCLYLILSETGSPASEILSLFTHEKYNHLSLSFDSSLYTMVSYNGGNNYQNPGLNTEDLADLNQKKDSQLLVYSLKIKKDNRLKILNKINQINKEGSAYNVLGLLTKVDVLPNMMYCSQFVYQMLEEVNLNFFQTTHDKIKPTDFIDYDLNSNLTFEFKIKFSEMNKRTNNY